MSTFFPAFQHKVTMFWFWGANKRCFVSAKKSKWLIFGPLPSTLPVLRIGDLVVELVHEFKCVSIWFSSVHANVFARHYAIKASKARNIVHQSIDTLGMLLRWGRNGISNWYSWKGARDATRDRTAGTGARFAGPRTALTPLNNARLFNILPVITPLVPDSWEQLLREADLCYTTCRATANLHFAFRKFPNLFLARYFALRAMVSIVLKNASRLT
ncbi:hypothetical protein B0H14DRAFT_3519174 [Mycena olivaceomarginata]|nr:hypothetical protein B0H14DRAFT_3519174 [Mycena olivaceomarginata]